jgi:hypothetical protein
VLQVALVGTGQCSSWLAFVGDKAHDTSIIMKEGMDAGSGEDVRGVSMESSNNFSREGTINGKLKEGVITG